MRVVPCPTTSTPYGMALVVSSTTRPTTPPDLTAGRLIYEADTGRILFYDGGGWVCLAEPWQTYAPALTATTTSPTLGAGSTQSGRYRRSDGTIEFSWYIAFGTGPTAGSGGYRISAPVAIIGMSRPSNIGVIMGSCNLYDFSATTFYSSTRLYVDTAGASVFGLAYGVGTAITNVTNSTPWTWAQGDELEGYATAQMNTRYL